jgi:hypothetical protein
MRISVRYRAHCYIWLRLSNCGESRKHIREYQVIHGGSPLREFLERHLHHITRIRATLLARQLRDQLAGCCEIVSDIGSILEQQLLLEVQIRQAELGRESWGFAF